MNERATLDFGRTFDIKTPQFRKMKRPASLLLLLASPGGAAAASSLFDVSADGTPVLTSEEAYGTASVSPDDPPAHDGSDSLIAQQFTIDPLGHRDPLEMVGDGTVSLVGISLLPTSLAGPGGSHVMVEGQFCSYDPDAAGGGLPASVAEARSEHCAEHRYALPLRDALKAARDADAAGIKDANGQDAVNVHELSGLVFEEGLQTPGGDLVTSTLAHLDGTHVVNDHPALRDALAACDVARARFQVEECDGEAQAELVRDVVYLLSRVQSKDADAAVPSAPADVKRTMYVKLSMESTVHLPLLVESFPSAPWTLVYDDDAEHALEGVTATKRGACARSARRPSEALVRKGEEIGGPDALKGLTVHEVCAAYLSAGLDAAVREFEDGDRGMLISRSEDMGGAEVEDGKAEAFLDRMRGHFGLEHHEHPVLMRVWDLVSLSPVVVPGEKRERDDLAEVERASELFMGESMDRLRRARRRKMV